MAEKYQFIGDSTEKSFNEWFKKDVPFFFYPFRILFYNAYLQGMLDLSRRLNKQITREDFSTPSFFKDKE